MPRKPFKAVPLRPQKGRRFAARRPAQKGNARWFLPLMIALPLATFTVVFLWDAPLPSRAHVPMDRDSASFEPCSGTVRTTCVVDGDTFWYRGKKIRIADINTPETSQPDCAREARLGAQATERLTQLLNRGPFTLETAGNDRDRYGRLLRVVTREGRSLGDILVEEGLAEPWKGYRGDWC